MNDVVQIPEEHTFAFKRMLNGLPEHLRDDTQTLQTLLAFFKLGGKALAQQWVEAKSAQFEERVTLGRRKSLTESDTDDDLADSSDDEELDINGGLDEEDEDPLAED